MDDDVGAGHGPGWGGNFCFRSNSGKTSAAHSAPPPKNNVFHNRYEVRVRSPAESPLHGGGAMIINERYIGISSIPRCSPRAELRPTPKHMTAISPAPATGTAPDTMATGVNAVSNPTVRKAIARPPYTKFARAAAPPIRANDDAATSPLTTANTANGTLATATTATATTVRRANT